MSYLGLDLGATNVKGALVDDEGRVLAHASEPLGDGAATLSPEAVADALARVAQSCVRDHAAFVVDEGALHVRRAEVQP